MCVLRNLSYRLYDEMPPSALQRLEGRGRRDVAGAPPGEVVGCFTPQSRRLREVGTGRAAGKGRGAGPGPARLTLRACPQLPLTADALTFAEVSKDPKGLEWLWSPQIVGLYNRLLQRCELNPHTTEAAAGALQNITAGDRRVRGAEQGWQGVSGVGRSRDTSGRDRMCGRRDRAGGSPQRRGRGFGYTLAVGAGRARSRGEAPRGTEGRTRAGLAGRPHCCPCTRSGRAC